MFVNIKGNIRNVAVDVAVFIILLSFLDENVVESSSSSSSSSSSYVDLPIFNMTEFPITNAKELCETQIFKATCTPPTAPSPIATKSGLARTTTMVVVMVTAKYGRMRKGECLKELNLVDAKCQFDVLAYFDRLCSGRRSCEVKVNSIMDFLVERNVRRDHTCLQSIRGFLEASYICVPVVSRSPHACYNFLNHPATHHTQPQPSQQPPQPPPPLNHILISETDKVGYLGNIVTEETYCGSEAHPWLLKAPRGQRIFLQLIDFTFDGEDLGKQGEQTHCQMFASVKDSNVISFNTICATSDKRQSNVFASQSDTVMVKIHAATYTTPANRNNNNNNNNINNNNNNNNHNLINHNIAEKKLSGVYFLLKYTLQGCADITATSGQWVQRMGSITWTGCNGTNDKYQLTCDNDKWISEDGVAYEDGGSSKGSLDCSSFWGASSLSTSFFGSFWAAFTESQWVAVATILSIALIIGVIIFLAGIVCIRKRRQNHLQAGGCTSPRCIAEYHIPNCPIGGHVDPSNLLNSGARQGSMTSKSLSMDLAGGSLDGSNAENDYFRTWQLQRNALNMRTATPGALNSPSLQQAHHYFQQQQQQQQQRQYPLPHHNQQQQLYNPQSASTQQSSYSFKPQHQNYNESGFFDNHNQQQPQQQQQLHAHQLQHAIEHIYESPKFDRKDYDSTIYDDGDGDVPLPPPPNTTTTNNNNNISTTNTTSTNTNFINHSHQVSNPLPPPPPPPPPPMSGAENLPMAGLPLRNESFQQFRGANGNITK